MANRHGCPPQVGLHGQLSEISYVFRLNICANGQLGLVIIAQCLRWYTVLEEIVLRCLCPTRMWTRTLLDLIWERSLGAIYRRACPRAGTNLVEHSWGRQVVSCPPASCWMSEIIHYQYSAKPLWIIGIISWELGFSDAEAILLILWSGSTVSGNSWFPWSQGRTTGFF